MRSRRFNLNREDLIPDNDLYVQQLSFDLRQHFDCFIVRDFVEKNKLQLFQKRPTAQNIITYINNQHNETVCTRPSDSTKNEIPKRMLIN